MRTTAGPLAHPGTLGAAVDYLVQLTGSGTTPLAELARSTARIGWVAERPTLMRSDLPFGGGYVTVEDLDGVAGGFGINLTPVVEDKVGMANWLNDVFTWYVDGLCARWGAPAHYQRGDTPQVGWELSSGAIVILHCLARCVAMQVFAPEAYAEWGDLVPVTEEKQPRRLMEIQLAAFARGGGEVGARSQTALEACRTSDIARRRAQRTGEELADSAATVIDKEEGRITLLTSATASVPPTVTPGSSTRVHLSTNAAQNTLYVTEVDPGDLAASLVDDERDRITLLDPSDHLRAGFPLVGTNRIGHLALSADQRTLYVAEVYAGDPPEPLIRKVAAGGVAEQGSFEYLRDVLAGRYQDPRLRPLLRRMESSGEYPAFFAGLDAGGVMLSYECIGAEHDGRISYASYEMHGQPRILRREGVCDVVR